jgi:hypothetical protein
MDNNNIEFKKKNKNKLKKSQSEKYYVSTAFYTTRLEYDIILRRMKYSFKI